MPDGRVQDRPEESLPAAEEASYFSADLKLNVPRLVAEHHEAVYRYAYRLTGSVPDAEDLTQQVFLAAQEGLDQLRCPESVRSWLFAILRNRFFKTCRREQPVAATSVGVDLDSLPSPENGDPIDSARLQEAIGGLGAEFRVVLAMFYFEQRSYREIAEQLQMPIGTVMSRLARAKRHLRARLFEPEGAEEAAGPTGRNGANGAPHHADRPRSPLGNSSSM
ncbi:MAG: sigma-70 family RNA polymerase sigma factor [Thermoguttaceae bacterium]